MTLVQPLVMESGSGHEPAAHAHAPLVPAARRARSAYVVGWQTPGVLKRGSLFPRIFWCARFLFGAVSVT